MKHLFLIEFLLVAGIVLVWIGYEYLTAKKLSEQGKQKEQEKQQQQQRNSLNNKDSSNK